MHHSNKLEVPNNVQAVKYLIFASRGNSGRLICKQKIHLIFRFKLASHRGIPMVFYRVVSPKRQLLMLWTSYNTLYK